MRTTGNATTTSSLTSFAYGNGINRIERMGVTARLYTVEAWQGLHFSSSKQVKKTGTFVQGNTLLYIE